MRTKCLNMTPAAALMSLTVLGAPPTILAHDWDDAGDAEAPFEEAEIFFELNDTDGDLGIHGLIDGGPWTYIKLNGAHDRRLMTVWATGKLWRQGVTEIFFESAEPTFDELAPEHFFHRFPEGVYEVEGRATDWTELESETLVTHTMPAPPEPSVNGMPAVEVCDEEDEDYDEAVLGVPGPGVTITWPDVEVSHPELGTMPPVEVSIYNYEVVVEAELEIDGEEFLAKMSAIVPPGVNSLSIPAEFIAQSERWKYEVLAREETFNQTAVESCFIVL